MDIEGEGEYLQSRTSINSVHNLKSLISEILYSNTAYDCMPINSSMSSIDKTLTLRAAIDVFVTENIEELLVWDEGETKWIWMLTTADIIRLIMHSIKCTARGDPINFTTFLERRHEAIPNLKKEQLEQMSEQLGHKSLGDIIGELRRDPNAAEVQLFMDLKTVFKDYKLESIVLTMILQKIHRIIIKDMDSRMLISIINFKDILLFLLRMANESNEEVYSDISIKTLLENNAPLVPKTTSPALTLADAFNQLNEVHRSQWTTVVDEQGCFQGMLFREDFRDMMRSFQLQKLEMRVGEYLDNKASMDKSRIPQYRFFEMGDTTKDIIWKIVMCRRNTIVCVDPQSRQVLAAIGLMELFRLYVQNS